MKKFLLGFIVVFLTLTGKAQQGLEKIIVEKYYVSDSADYDISGGTLPVGSVTWRLYVDMAPGFVLQLVGGDVNHSLKFTTTTSFFNDGNGSTDPNGITTNMAKTGVTLLDSYVSMGAASKSYWGILKSEQTTANLIVGSSGNNDGAFKNAKQSSGFIPLTHKDGLISAGAVPPVGYLTVSGSSDEAAFNYLNDGTVSGNSFILSNGQWFKLGGVFGPTSTNRVLVAQITTDGTFHYELNLQLGKDLGEGQSMTERYAVYPAPGEYGGEQYNLSGTLNPDETTSVTITSPLGNSTYKTGDTVTITSGISGAGGSITRVEYYADSLKIGESDIMPYKLSWKSTAGKREDISITAVAYDYDSIPTASSPVIIKVKGNTPPEVTITSPASGSYHKPGQSVDVTANASDSDGSVISVIFYVDGVVKDTVKANPYNFSFTPESGSHYIKAMAKDNEGATSSDSILIKVENKLPVVTITSPLSGDTAKQFTIIADASDPDGNIVAVEFFADGISIGKDSIQPYSAIYNGTDGAHTITAKAIDNDGGQAVSAPVDVVVGLFNGIDNIKASGYALAVYPNPAVNDLFLKIAISKPCAHFRYKVFAIDGRLTTEKTIGQIFENHIETIDITSLSKGQYIVELYSDCGITTLKFIKQ